MPHVTTILGNEVGVQYQGTRDASSLMGAAQISGLIVGQFKRGRLDQPMTITLENVKGTLGEDLGNPDYLAVLDALAGGVPSVQVMRVNSGMVDNVVMDNEFYFTTIAGNLDYSGVVGDQIIFSDGTTITLDEDDLNDIIAPDGKHKVLLKEHREASYVGIGGDALIELHNFPTLSTITNFDFSPNESSPNLVKVPTVLPSNLTNISWMFYDATSFNQDISMWNVSNVTRMDGMFRTATAFNQDISMWNVSNVTRMNKMFYNATSFNQPLNSWNVSNVTNMDNMFNEATAFNQDISMWNVSNVTNMDGMFYDATAFNQDLSKWCVGLIPTLPTAFDTNTPSWTLPKPVWGTCPTLP